MRNAKKTIVVVALIALMAIPSMFAYFTDKGEVTNTFEFGNVSIELKETLEGNEVAEGTTGTVTGVVPGQIISKEVWVENASESAAYIFLQVDETNADMYETLELNTEYWAPLDGETNVYYHLVAANENPSAGQKLFTTVNVKDTLDKTVNTFEIKVTAYAVQDSEDFEDAAAAWEVAETATAN